MRETKLDDYVASAADLVRRAYDKGREDGLARVQQSKQDRMLDLVRRREEECTQRDRLMRQSLNHLLAPMDPDVDAEEVLLLGGPCDGERRVMLGTWNEWLIAGMDPVDPVPMDRAVFMPVRRGVYRRSPLNRRVFEWEGWS